MKPWPAVMVRVLVASALLFAPLAPMSANCAPTGGTDTAPSLTQTAFAAPGHDCCVETDQAGLDGNIDLSKCKVGCIAIPGVSLSTQSAMTRLTVVAELSLAGRGIADWLPPPLYDPPILRS